MLPSIQKAVYKEKEKIMESLWTDSIGAVEQNAVIDFWADDSAWKIELVPEDGAVKSVLNKILVTGKYSEKEASVDSIKMEQADGSSFLYELSNHQYSDTITDDEKSLFTE